MTEIVKTYESDYLRSAGLIQAQLSQLQNAGKGKADPHLGMLILRVESKLPIISSVHNDITDAENTLNLMEIQIPSLPVAERAKFNQNIKRYKGDLDTQKKTVQKYKEEFGWEQDKENLFGGESSSKERLIAGKSNKIAEQNNKLIEAKKLAFEAEGTSINVQRELLRNTDVLQNALNKVRRTDGHL